MFKGYEAGSPVGHRNVIHLNDEIDPPLDATLLHGFHPLRVFSYYRDCKDVLIIPHHVKTWTDWSFHDPDLEPPGGLPSGGSPSPRVLNLWDKGQTPGAGAWEAYRRGYKLGMIASSDNHVGMPGRNYAGDRQNQLPFKAGLRAVSGPRTFQGNRFLKRCTARPLPWNHRGSDHLAVCNQQAAHGSIIPVYPRPIFPSTL